MSEPRYIRRLAKIQRAGKKTQVTGVTDYESIELILEEAGERRAPWRRRGALAMRLYLRVLPRSRAAASSTREPRGWACTRPTAARSGVAGDIDHTLLKPDATREDIDKLCREAAEWKFATVCVNPTWVASAARTASRQRRRRLLGGRLSAGRHHRRREAVRGAARDLRRRDRDRHGPQRRRPQVRRCAAGASDIRGVVQRCHAAGAGSKVILETALLTDEEKVTACTLAKAAGADFVKTSTGFGPGGATAADVALMRRVVGDEMGVKAAGGVRDLQQVKAMVAAGATRIGASAGVRIVKESRGEATAAGSAGTTGAKPGAY